MITFKDGGVSSYTKLYSLTPQNGETFISKDGTILVFILDSGYVIWTRTDVPSVLHYSTVSEVTFNHTFKRVDVEITVKAI